VPAIKYFEPRKYSNVLDFDWDSEKRVLYFDFDKCKIVGQEVTD